MPGMSGNGRCPLESRLLRELMDETLAGGDVLHGAVSPGGAAPQILRWSTVRRGFFSSGGLARFPSSQ